jgi:mRNA-degrading endonuclease RelE of RelBE toxin-antitoxin system
MSFRIIATPFFEKELKHLLKKYPSIKKDLAELADKLQQEPRMGTLLGHDKELLSPSDRVAFRLS